MWSWKLSLYNVLLELSVFQYFPFKFVYKFESLLYNIENTRLKKIIPNLFGQTEHFLEIEPCEKGHHFVQKVYGARTSGVYY